MQAWRLRRGLPPPRASRCATLQPPRAWPSRLRPLCRLSLKWTLHLHTSSYEFQCPRVQARGWKGLAHPPSEVRARLCCLCVREGPHAPRPHGGPLEEAVGVGCSAEREGWRATRSTLERQAGRVRPICAWCWGRKAEVWRDGRRSFGKMVSFVQLRAPGLKPLALL